MKIHIMVASCAGSTTLGRALAELWGYTYFDTDVYFWQPPDIPFTIKRTFEDRNQLLKGDLQKHQNIIVGGSLINWGEDWQTFFDLVVFLYIPQDIRLQRLKERELARYGAALTRDVQIGENYRKYLVWAAGYDNGTTGRNLKAHQNWLKLLPCKTMEILGDTSVHERIGLIADKLNRI